jgi:CubicO group peptidase (beta-lactamase class C family)
VTARRARGALRLLCALPLALPACLPDEHWKRRGPTEPEALADGWGVDTPESVGLDPDVLAAIHDELLREDRHFGTLGFMVVKDRKLVYETYLVDADDRDRLHHVQSMTKSVTSLAFGIAIDRGLIGSVDETLGDYLPQAVFEGLDERKPEITLEQLLTMRSGIDFDNDTFSLETQVDRPRNTLRYMLEKPLFADPGKRFVYRDVDPSLISYVIEAAAGERLADFVRQNVFEPLGIEDFHWEAMPDGASTGAHALHLRPRDTAKLGQLMLECFEGESALVSQAYCSEATSLAVSPDETLGTRLDRGYGYYFWVLPDYDAFAAWGHGGQYLLVVPDQDLVLVQVALPDSDLHGGQLEDFVALTRPLFCPSCPEVD